MSHQDFEFRCFWEKYQVFLFHQDSVILKNDRIWCCKFFQTEQTVDRKKSGFRTAQKKYHFSFKKRYKVKRSSFEWNKAMFSLKIDGFTLKSRQLESERNKEPQILRLTPLRAAAENLSISLNKLNYLT